ncbi:MAG: F0F1 ATP synthase subunit B [Candidatus Paceibacterota bacterium]
MEILGKVGFDWQVALANLINFLIVFWLIKKFFFKTIKNTIKERKEVIDKGLEDAKRAESALVLAASEKEEVLKKAYNESKSIIEEADKKAKKAISDSKKEGAEEAEKIKESALKDIEKIKEDTEKKIQKDFVNMVLDGVEKVSINQIDKNKSQAFAESLLK